jgi:hypothetical protein
MDNTQPSLRESLESSFDAVDTTPAVENVAPVASSTEPAESRDDQGRFAAKVAPENIAPDVEVNPRPRTWKKEFLPLWDKMNDGVALTPEESKTLAQYSGHQREREFSNGINTFKAEAGAARELQSAIEPFLPQLQRHNIKPTEWIGNLGRAHEMLALGSAEQKLQMFSHLAKEYGVPLAALGSSYEGQLDPIVPQLMEQIQKLSGQVNTVTTWRDQQEQASIVAQLAPFQDSEKYPHYEQVRVDMALLLETGKANDLETAYKKALRFNDEIWDAEQERLAQSRTTTPVAAAARAKTRAVQTKSSTPRGPVSTGTKDRLSSLTDAFDALESGRV